MTQSEKKNVDLKQKGEILPPVANVLFKPKNV
jgi:hypothetical protein